MRYAKHESGQEHYLESNVWATRSKTHYRSIFISDLHLGTPGCQADALLEFLKNYT